MSSRIERIHFKVSIQVYCELFRVREEAAGLRNISFTLEEQLCLLKAEWLSDVPIMFGRLNIESKIPCDKVA